MQQETNAAATQGGRKKKKSKHPKKSCCVLDDIWRGVNVWNEGITHILLLWGLSRTQILRETTNPFLWWVHNGNIPLISQLSLFLFLSLFLSLSHGKISSKALLGRYYICLSVYLSLCLSVSFLFAIHVSLFKISLIFLLHYCSYFFLFSLEYCIKWR